MLSHSLHSVAAGIARAGRKVTICDRDFIVELVKMEYGSLFNYAVIQSLKQDQNGKI
jgi:hypothetical protein